MSILKHCCSAHEYKHDLISTMYHKAHCSTDARLIAVITITFCANIHNLIMLV